MEYFQQETVREAMSRSVRTVAPEMTVGDLLRLFASDELNAYPVVRDGTLLGIVSRSDVIKPFATKSKVNNRHFDEVMGTTVEEFMPSQVITVQLGATMQEVVELMISHDLESFPVVDRENRIKGIIARQDIVRALARCAWRSSSLPLPLPQLGYAIA